MFVGFLFLLHLSVLNGEDFFDLDDKELLEVKDLLCMIEKGDRSCEYINLPKYKQKKFKTKYLSLLYVKVDSYNNTTTDAFRTHSLHSALTYFKYLNKDVYLIVCGKSNAYLCTQFNEYNYENLFYGQLDKTFWPLQLSNKFGKYYFKETDFLNFFTYMISYGVTLPTIILSDLLSNNIFKAFILELKYLSNEKFLVNYHRRLQREYASIKSDHDYIELYNTYKCKDKSNIKTCTKTKLYINVFKELSTFDILCRFSKDLLDGNLTEIELRYNQSEYNRNIISKYVLPFCKRLLFVVYETDAVDNILESKVDSILSSINVYDSVVFKISRNVFEEILPTKWIYPKSKNLKTPELVLCGSNIIRCVTLTPNTFSLYKPEIRSNVERHFVHFINEVEYHDYQLKEARERLFCYDVIGDCYDVFKYIPLQMFYEYRDQNEKDEYYEMKKNIIIKVFYMIWSLTSLKTLRLYDLLLNQTERTGLLNFIGMDICDVQLIRINCLQMNIECKNEEILSYPTVKVVFPKKSKKGFVYKRDPLNTEHLIQFIINCAINPFFYSKWTSEEILFFNFISVYYENIILVGLWQHLELQDQKMSQKLFDTVQNDYLIIVIDVEKPPEFIKKKINLDLSTKPGIYLINVRHLIVKNIFIPPDSENVINKLRKVNINMIAQLSYERILEAKKSKIPIFVVFYYHTELPLTSTFRNCYHHFEEKLSFNHVNLWENYKMYQLFNEYECKNTPCFTIFNFSEKVHTLSGPQQHLVNVTQWLHSIFNGSTTPNVILKKIHSMEFYHTFDYVDSYDSKKGVFESLNKQSERLQKNDNNYQYHKGFQPFSSDHSYNRDKEL